MGSRVALDPVRIAEWFHRVLLNPCPDMSSVEADLIGYGQTEQTARRTIYETVLSINRTIFPPLSKLELLLTEGCNMACRYCFEQNILADHIIRKRIMSDAVIERSINLLFDYGEDQKEFAVTLFGGEPTLALPGVRRAVEYAEKRVASVGASCSFNMTSNGLLLSDEMIDFAADKKIKILLSVDGLAASHDAFRVDKGGQPTFARVIANLRKLKAKQPWIGVKMTIMPSEAPLLCENVRGLRDLGANQFVIGRATGADWPEEAQRAFVEQMAKLQDGMRDAPSADVRITDFEQEAAPTGLFGCGAARTGIAVNVAGEVSGCSRIISLESGVTVGKLGDVDYGLYCLKERLRAVGCSELAANCASLGIADEYRGGCFAVNYEDTGNMYAPSLLEHGMKQRLLQSGRASMHCGTGSSAASTH